MRKLIALCTGLFLLTTAQATTHNTKMISFGIGSSYYSSEQLDKEWTDVFNAIEKATGKEVKIMHYQNQLGLIQGLEKNKIDLAYIKTIPAEVAMKANPKIKFLSAAVSKNPKSGDELDNYEGYIVANKDSSVKSLNDLDNKTVAYYDRYSASSYIQVKYKLNKLGISVHWLKVDSPLAAFEAVDKHHADATGTWDYFYDHLANKNDFKIIDTIPNLPHPVLVFNSKSFSNEEVQKIQDALRHVKAPGVIGFKPL